MIPPFHTDPLLHLRTVAGWFGFCAAIVLVISVGYGCAAVPMLASSLPAVQAQGHFTEAEMRAAVDAVFGRGTYAMHATGQNVRSYTTYRLEDYLAVSEHVRARTEAWSYGWLCVQFAQQMRLEMYRAGVQSGSTDYPAAIGWFIVRQAYSWGGVPGGPDGEGRHALNVFVAGPRGSMDVWVLEPQSGVRARVGRQQEDGTWKVFSENYPNLPYVERRGVFLEL